MQPKMASLATIYQITQIFQLFGKNMHNVSYCMLRSY